MKIVAQTNATDSDIWFLFKSARKDTVDIAAELNVTEAYVARRLAFIRDRIHAQVVESLPA